MSSSEYGFRVPLIVVSLYAKPVKSLTSPTILAAS
jgi:hypothetical protein